MSPTAATPTTLRRDARGHFRRVPRLRDVLAALDAPQAARLLPSQQYHQDQADAARGIAT